VHTRHRTQDKDKQNTTQKSKIMSNRDPTVCSLTTEEAEAVNIQAEEERALKKIRDHNMKKCKSLQMLKVNTMVCFIL
jgi:hypothetical protein